MIKNKDIIIIGSIDWKTNWQTQHRLVTSLVKQNNRVLFIENTGVRSARISDFSRIKDRINNWFKSAKGFKEIQKNLFIFSPIVLPFPFNKICYLINLFIVKFLLANWLNALKFKNDMLVSFLPTPLSHKVKNLINANFNIYYCANEMKGIESKNKKIDEFENHFFKESDITFVISSNLKKKANVQTKNSFILPAGVELSKFDIKKVKKKISIKGKPVVGYIGAITQVFDQNLLEFISKNNPNFNFVIIGRVYVDIKKLKKIKNIFFLNEVKHEKLPSYIHGFDLGIIPYKVNKFTNSVYSCKLNEYLSMGLPVVSTKIRESNIYNKNFNNIISIGKTYEQFNIKIRENIKNNSKDKVNNRIKAAKKNSWESRFNYFNELIEKKIFNKSSVNQSWKSKFIEKYNKFFYTNIKKTSLIILIFILIFKTPIIPLLGSFLIVQDEIKNTKVMIVFSGDGENNYHNLSFQKRIIDILNIKKKYPNIKIILSGRAAVFNESEIVKSLLINDGVSKKDITTIKEDPYNTYENIAVVNKLLKKNDVKKIIFLTSPYHTYRSKRIWNKNFPEVKVVIPKMIDTPDKKLKWSISYQEIKIIFYEYLAILYNKYKGWI
jgi:uncharacterized SAM-binding protein YcdF (DUF218 family)